MKIILLVFLCFSAYLLGLFLYNFVKKLTKLIAKPIKNAKVNKYGISFFSNARHKLKMGDVKILEIKNCVYLKQNNQTIVIKNIQDILKTKKYLFFTAKGEVKIIFNTKSFYRYFNIEIMSPTFDLSILKQNAINEMLNNLFNLNNCDELKHYLKIVIEILNIRITENKISVRKNDFNLTFQLIYKLNNTIKKINIGESF